jgi:hypothetical protein
MFHSRLLVLLATAIAVCAGCTDGGGQVDPGTQGTGTEPQPGPYAVPTEATAPLPGAPQGSLSPPAFFASTIYPGKKFRYQIYVPAQYRAGQAAVLMVFQDGPFLYLDLLKTPWVVNRRRGLTGVRRPMLTMHKRVKLTILIEKCRPEPWSVFDTC